MPDTHRLRVSREIFLTAFGAELGAVEPWVTDRLTAMLEDEDVCAGESLFSAGDPADYFYFLRRGTVKLVCEGSEARTVHGPGVIGVFDVLLDRPRMRSAIVLDSPELMKVRADAWIELLEDSFELARAAVLRSAREVALLEVLLLGKRVLPWPVGPRPSYPVGARLGLIERLALLMDAPPLRAAGVQTLSDLAASSEEVVVAPGSVLFEGQVTRSRFFLVVEGQVDGLHEPSNMVCPFGPGDIVSGAGAFGEPALAWTARAKTKARTLAFRIEDWFDLMEEHFDLVRSALAASALERERLLDLLASNPGGPPRS
jgi:CRP-like cAMP-binding protein